MGKYKSIKKLVLLVVFLFSLIVLSCNMDILFVYFKFDPDNLDLKSVGIDINDYKEPVVFFGDTRSNHKIHKRIVNLISLFNPVAVFHTGDLVNDGNSSDDWDIFFKIEGNLIAKTQFYPAAGNHEEESDLYYNFFDLPGNEKWYSVNLNGYHFIILNSNLSMDPGSQQYNWLVEDLEMVSGETGLKAIFLVFHHPLFSTGYHGPDVMNLKPVLLPLIEEYNIKAVFNGHDHCYERSFYNGTYFIVAGGGGAPLYPRISDSIYSQIYLAKYHFIISREVENKTIFDVFDVNLEKIDSFEINWING